MDGVQNSHQNSTSSLESAVGDGAPVAPLKKSEVQDDAPVDLLNANMLQLRVTGKEKSDESYPYKKVVKDLVNWLSEDDGKRMGELEESVKKALSYDIVELKLVGITDAKSFLKYANKMLYWVPQETFDGKDVYYHIILFYFVLNQFPLRKYQTPIRPESVGHMSWLTRWLVDYAVEVGRFCDDPGSLSAESLDTFRASPQYKMSNYIEPRGGWKTFNQFFARDFKPGYRNIYGLSDPSVIVSPADCTFCGSWNINSHSEVKLKHLVWNISDLLQGSRYASDFREGVFTHSFLNTYDYHRLHAPVEGKVLESKVIHGQAYIETQMMKGNELDPNSHDRLETVRYADAPDNPGYQFVQMRGLIIIDSPVGLVAVLPIGMATVSSVVMTAEKGVWLRKGEEIGYFQFGGSDVVSVYQKKSNVAFTAVEGIHLSMGMPIAHAKVQP